MKKNAFDDQSMVRCYAGQCHLKSVLQRPHSLILKMQTVLISSLVTWISSI